MDPNEALKNLRDAAKDVAVIRYRQQPVTDMVEAFNALDEWLSKGGFLPAAWVRPVSRPGSLKEQFDADVAAVEAQWQAAQPLVQQMLDDWRKINDAEMGQDGWAPIGPFTVMCCEECDTDREVHTYTGGVVTFRVCGHTENFKQ